MWWILACTDPVADSGRRVDTDSGVVEPTFDLPRSPTWESLDEGVATGLGVSDWDADGDVDVVVSYGNDIRPGPIAVYENDEGLPEQPTWTSSKTAFYGHLSIGDVDGDGLDDVAVSRFLGPDRFDTPGGVEVHRNVGGALEPLWASEEAFFTFSCALGDMDLDGDLDLAVAVGEHYHNDPDHSLVYENDGTGAFTLVWTTEAPRHSFDVAWVDLDGDLDLDLAFANAGTPHTVYENLGGSLATEPSWEAPGEAFEGNSLDFGDLDGDGLPDLAITDNTQKTGDGLARAYCGPDLEVCWTSDDGERYQSAISLEDVDVDGDLDVALGSWGQSSLGDSVRVYSNDSGVIQSTSGYKSSTSTVIEAFAWADLDGSHDQTQTLSGHRLIEVPGRIVRVTGGVAGDRVATGPGALEVEYLLPAPRDLVVTNWDEEHGNHVYGR
ncbi:MAG: VCBS repeat-containing protein [Proteobacteria bacterium]|nr:VCBS repeat-containing protein [Pseudomonadota bacterium]MCP4916302.1 VCBS repeat-containing protein [Pseudomonadota bacterium]